MKMSPEWWCVTNEAGKVYSTGNSNIRLVLIIQFLRKGWYPAAISGSFLAPPLFTDTVNCKVPTTSPLYDFSRSSLPPLSTMDHFLLGDVLTNPKPFDAV
jgi:hypothetical protein